MGKPRPLQVLLICCFVLLLVSGAHPVAAARSPAAAPAPAPVTPPAAAPVTTTPAAAPVPTPAAPTTHKWNVGYIMWAPDCKQRVMIGINGEFPGPSITAKAGDEIIVEVTNHLHTEGVVIHWHGIRQIGTPWADGTASISQCPINPGDTFTYRFKADKPGTFFYHGHFGMQRAAGLYGSLIVKPVEEEPFAEKYPYQEIQGEDAEPMSMLLSDWWHENVYAQAAGLDGKGKHWQWVGEPQTLLINGRGQFGCSLGKPDGACRRNEDQYKLCLDEGSKDKQSDEENKVRCDQKIRRSECGPFCKDTQCSPVVFRVHPGEKYYRLRIASTTSLSALNVKVQGHTMTVVEADGNFVQPLEEEIEDIDIYSGESYSVLLSLKPDMKTTKPSAYWITVRTIGRKHRTPPALAILRYDDGAWPADPAPETPMDKDEEELVKKEVKRSKDFAKKIKAWKPPKGYSAPPPELKSTNPRVITLLNTQDKLKDGDIKWAINHVSLSLPATPYLGAYFYNIAGSVLDGSAEPPNTYDSRYDIGKPSNAQAPGAQPPPLSISNRVFRIDDGAVVDVVLQNANMLEQGVSEPHPWHLHGHEFWVLGYGEGRYDAATADKQLDMVSPPLRNTVVLFPGGWTKIRFVADNPGVWAFHCHIEPHLHMGMGVIFAEGIEKLQELKELSEVKEAFTCGKALKAALAPTPAAVVSPQP